MANLNRTKVSSTLLASTAIVSISIFGSLSAYAAEYVVDTPGESTVYLGTGDNDGHAVMIETTGSIVDDEGIGFYQGAEDNTISLVGDGSIDASNGDGIFFEGSGNDGNVISLADSSYIDASDDGIDFRGVPNVDNVIVLTGNSYISAGDNGIEFGNGAEDTFIALSGNSYISSDDSGIFFNDDAYNVNISLSDNSRISAGDYGIEFDDDAQNITINLSGFAVITANTDSGIYFADDADGVDITLSDNSKVYADDYGIGFYSAPQDVTIRLEDSAAIYADEDGIYLGDDSDGVTINIEVNALIQANGYGIYFYDDSDNAIVNLSGEIASGDTGIYFDSPDNGFELNIDGKIVSQTDDAIDLGNANDAELNLAAPAFIGGAFNLPSSAIVTIATGASHSVLWEFPQGNFDGEVATGTVAWAYDDATNQFATVDPTAFSRSADQLADLGGLAFSAVRGVGQSSDGTTWVSVSSTGSAFETSGNLLDSMGTASGVMAGRQLFSSGNLSVGVLLGGMSSSFAASSIWSESYDNSASGFLGGIYGALDAGGISLGFALAGGALAHTDTRFVNDNLADQGLATASASYNSTLMMAGVDISTSALNLSNGWAIVPTAFANYSTQTIDGYTEEGDSDANAIVAGRTVSVAEYGLDFALSKAMGGGVLTATAGVSSRNYMGDETVSVQLLDDVIEVQSGVSDAQVIGYVGANWTTITAADASVSFGGGLNLGEGMTGYNLSVSIDFNF